jgi:serine/threonine protein kinase
MEWIEGGTLFSLIKNKNLREKQFSTEMQFLRMVLILFNELKFFHNSNLIHRDIKTENIMWWMEEQDIVFMLTDFGFTINLNEVTSFFPYSKPYSPPELKEGNNFFSSDIFSLAVTFKEVLRFTKIQVSQTILDLFDQMVDDLHSKRPSLDECIESVINYCFSQNYRLQIVEYLKIKLPYIQSKINFENFEKMREIIENDKKLLINTF